MKHTLEGRRRGMTKRRKIILACLALLLSCYLIPSIYISAKVYTIARNSYDHYGEDNPFSEIIADEFYKKMSHRYRLKSNEKEYNIMPFPMTYFADGGAKTTYRYWSNRGHNIPVYVTLALEGWKWVVVGLYEPP